MKEIIYLDTKLVNSFIAQLNKGIITKLSEENSETDSNSETFQENKAVTSSAGFNVMINGNISGSKTESDGFGMVFSTSNKNLVETALDDYSLDVLLNQLIEQDKLKTSSYNDGDLILVEGEVTTYDFKQLSKVTDLTKIDFMLPDYDKFNKIKNEYNKIKSKTIPRKDELKSELENNGWYNFERMKLMSDYLDDLIPDSTLFKINDILSIAPNRMLRVSNSHLSFMQLGDRKIKILGICTSTIDEQVPSDFSIMSESDQVIRLAPTTILNILLGSFNLMDSGDHIVRPIAIYFE